jgi:uncharacterized protein YjbJ (UPF0337 family)
MIAFASWPCEALRFAGVPSANGRREPSAPQLRYSFSEAATPDFGDLLIYYGRNFASRLRLGRYRSPDPHGRTITVNWDQIKGHWKQFTDKAKEQWGKLTDDDWKVIKGKRDQLIGKMQERYGIAKDEAEKQVKEFERHYDKV